MKVERGFVLIEILVGLALLGIIASTFLSGLTTAFNGVSISQERVAAESLGKSQIEYIKAQDYILVADYDPTDPAKSYDVIDIPPDLAGAGYTVEIVPPETVLTEAGGFELQSITVLVKRNGQVKLAITICRVND